MNIDNLYSSPLIVVKLNEISLYARGTICLNRKYLPCFMKYLDKDMKKLLRGSCQFAVYNMTMHCWNDKNHVYILSKGRCGKLIYLPVSF